MDKKWWHHVGGIRTQSRLSTGDNVDESEFGPTLPRGAGDGHWLATSEREISE
jgi:hypothetical protein